MKRKWYQYIAVLLICIFALTGCGSSQEKEKENQDSAPEIAGFSNAEKPKGRKKL